MDIQDQIYNARTRLRLVKCALYFAEQSVEWAKKYPLDMPASPTEIWEFKVCVNYWSNELAELCRMQATAAPNMSLEMVFGDTD